MRIKRAIRSVPVTEIRVVGIDASLRSTGFAYRHLGVLYTGTVTSGELRGPYRLSYIKRKISEVIDIAQPTVIVMEDYAKGRGPNISMPYDIGELGGVLKTMFWELGISVILVSPKSLKMIITGSGNAGARKKGQPKVKGKPEMRAALENTFGYTINQDDEADAVGLLLVGELAKGVAVVSESIRSTLRLDTLDSFPVVEGRKLKLISKQLEKMK